MTTRIAPETLKLADDKNNLSAAHAEPAKTPRQDFRVLFTDGTYEKTSDPVHTILSNDGLEVEEVFNIELGNVTEYWMTEVEDRLVEIENDEPAPHEWSRDRIRRYYERGL